MEHITGKEGISRNASLAKIKSISEGLHTEECREIELSGTVETNPWSSSQDLRGAAHGDVFFPPGLHVLKCMLKSPARRIGEEASGRQSKRWERLPW
jgi:hypothetical protein